jgi:hypothetical protein
MLFAGGEGVVEALSTWQPLDYFPAVLGVSAWQVSNHPLRNEPVNRVSETRHD